MTADRQTTIEPLLVNAATAAKLLSVSRSKFYSMHSAGLVPMPLTLGQGSIRWSVDELREFVRAGCPSREKWELIKGTQNA
jgi:predicted DNA-binding transcriptional regulator AlpA